MINVLMGNAICTESHTQVIPSNINDYDNYKDYKKILKHLLPTWYIKNPKITSDDYNLVKTSWDLIYLNQLEILDTGETFDNISDFTDFSYEEKNTAIVYFIKSFYDRLFDIRPEFKQLFKNDIILQGFKLAKMINFIIEKMNDNNSSLQHTFKKLIHVHNNYGVKPDHYKVMMDNLLKILEKTMGSIYFTDEVKLSWKKIISHLLNILAPIALNEENLQHYNKHHVFNV